MLREKLQHITEEEDVSKHPQMLYDLKGELSHSISVVESNYDLSTFTCVMHAFDFVGDEYYSSIASFGLGNVFAGTKFVKFLLANNYLKAKAKPDANEGDIALYFDGHEVKHAGLAISDKRLISKWGCGQLLEHDLFEVPMQYGEIVKFYYPIDKEKALDIFTEFAESKGIQFGNST